MPSNSEHPPALADHDALLAEIAIADRAWRAGKVDNFDRHYRLAEAETAQDRARRDSLVRAGVERGIPKIRIARALGTSSIKTVRDSLRRADAETSAR